MTFSDDDRRAIDDHKAKKRAEFEQRREAWERDVLALPPSFRKRIEFFCERAAWAADFGDYELFVCQEAVKILDALRTEDRIKRFAEERYEEQRRMVPALAGGHSGNTICVATMLAHRAAAHDDLWRMHGALCGLVECEVLGCNAARASA